jgi:hypothetical protein
VNERAYTQEQLLRRLSLRQDTLAARLRANLAEGSPLFDLRPYGEVQPEGSLLIRDPAALEAALRADLQKLLTTLVQSMLDTAYADRP